MKILIDTNIFLDFYRYEKETIELLKELENHSDKIIFTQQLVDEFERNREGILSQVKARFAGVSQLENFPPSLISDDEEFIELNNIRKEYSKQRKKVLEKIEKFIDDETHDPVATVFNNLTHAAKENGLFWRINELTIKAAQNRKLLGNPPTSEGKTSIGDEINWELILENSHDDIVIIGRDSTYEKNTSYLKKEYTRRTSKKILAITKNIKDGLSAAGITINPKLKDIEEVVIQEPMEPAGFIISYPWITSGGTFVISRRTNNEYQFSLKAANGQVILTSEGYAAKSGCSFGIEAVRKNAPDDWQYDRKTASNGKYFFTLKNGNGQIIGTSQLYESASGRDNGIESVKKNAPSATINDYS